jgi:hypothetical protein
MGVSIWSIPRTIRHRTFLQCRLKEDRKQALNVVIAFPQCRLKGPHGTNFITVNASRIFTKSEAAFIAHTIFCLSAHINTGSYVISQKQRSLPSRELLYKPQVLPMASKLATAAASILILALLLVSSGKPFSNYIVVFGLSYVKVK